MEQLSGCSYATGYSCIDRFNDGRRTADGILDSNGIRIKLPGTEYTNGGPTGSGSRCGITYADRLINIATVISLIDGSFLGCLNFVRIELTIAVNQNENII